MGIHLHNSSDNDKSTRYHKIFLENSILSAYSRENLPFQIIRSAYNGNTTISGCQAGIVSILRYLNHPNQKVRNFAAQTIANLTEEMHDLFSNRLLQVKLFGNSSDSSFIKEIAGFLSGICTKLERECRLGNVTISKSDSNEIRDINYKMCSLLDFMKREKEFNSLFTKLKKLGFKIKNGLKANYSPAN